MSDSVFCSWSGGKDCCLALDKFMAKDPTVNIVLLTMMDEANRKTYGHFLSEEILKAQAAAMNWKLISVIPVFLIMRKNGRSNY